MLSHSKYNLINKPIEGDIGEPWNFVSEAGNRVGDAAGDLVDSVVDNAEYKKRRQYKKCYSI